MGVGCEAKAALIVGMKDYKSHFTQLDYKRAFGSGSFRNAELVTDVFSEIFSQNPPENLVHMTDTKLDRLIVRIGRSKKVMEMQAVLAEERKEGEASLNALADIFFAQLQKIGIAPPNKGNVYAKRYEEWWAYCGTEVDTKRTGIALEPPMPIAKGLFHASSAPLENIVFTPENTFYSDLRFLFRNGKIQCEHGNDI